MNKKFWENKNVLVTGAGGFKGSHIVQSLVKSKARVVSLIRDYDPKSYFEQENLGKKSITVIGDLKDYRKIADILSMYDIDSIFHLGAQPIVTTALVNPLETLESNIMGTVNILEAARVYSNPSEILIVTSDKAYGPTDRIPYKETERLQGKAPYDVSKSCADLISQMYHKVYDMPVTIARCANVFGPGDLNMNRIIPGIIETAIKNKTLEIRSDGKMIREYIYVKDTADAYITLLENIKKSKGEAFNVSGENVLSVMELVNMVSKIIAKPIKYKILNQARTEIPKQHLDGTKMKEFFNWQPKTKFSGAILDTYEWYEEML
ncbi:NAD-dependent epimerase/dehydratase family protein [Candidatus Pacearchaeota archaeon]|nr:NAD-dependent epimerase/dehydratase family protein [Candidatus Pacearchaeota archaeon]